MQARVWTAIGVGAVVVVMCTLFTPATVSPSLIHTEHDPAVLNRAAADGPERPHAGGDALDGAVDLYGNEVIDAIATYSLDPAGSPYEVHSPQTELPKLASPKS